MKKKLLVLVLSAVMAVGMMQSAAITAAKPNLHVITKKKPRELLKKRKSRFLSKKQ